MYKKISIIIIALLVLILIGILVVAFFIAPQQEKTTTEVLREFIPFGQPTQTIEEKGVVGGREDGRDENQKERSDDILIGGQQEVSRLRQLSSAPVAGMGVYLKEGPTQEEDVYLRYVDQSSGNVFEVNAETFEKTRLSNTTILGIKRAFWTSNPNVLVIQYLDEGVVQTLIATLVGVEDGVVGELEGEFLESNITALTLSPNQEELFYLKEFGDVVIGTTVTLEENTKKQIFNHPLKEWLVNWYADDKIALTTKPSYNTLGHSFSLDVQSDILSPFVTNTPGLTINPSTTGERVVYSTTLTGNPLRVVVHNTQTSGNIVFPLSTLPEKCVWSRKNPNDIYCAGPQTLPQGQFPDDWYQGNVFFSDEIWRLNTETGATSLLASPTEEVGIEIDAINLMLDKEEEYLFFINKKTGRLWELRLQE